MAGLSGPAAGLAPRSEWCAQGLPPCAPPRARALPLSRGAPLGTRPSPLRHSHVTACCSLPGASARRRSALLAGAPAGRATALTQGTRAAHPGRTSAAEPGVQQKTEAEAEAEGAGAGDSTEDISKDIAKAVKKTASTFAPRASGKSRNPATPGSTLYRIFEVQAYVSMAVGGLLSFNLLFPSDEPDIWRLMGMWSVWMFTIPSLRARDCPEREKTALNYLFLVVPLINVSLPLVWKSFAAVWTSDVIAFLAFYAWKMEWFKQSDISSSE